MSEKEPLKCPNCNKLITSVICREDYTLNLVEGYTEKTQYETTLTYSCSECDADITDEVKEYIKG